MKFAEGTLFQRNQMSAGEFLKADLYEEVDANLLDRVYKTLLVTLDVLTIVRAKEIVSWAEHANIRISLDGRWHAYATGASSGSGSGSNPLTPSSLS